MGTGFTLRWQYAKEAEEIAHEIARTGAYEWLADQQPGYDISHKTVSQLRQICDAGDFRHPRKRDLRVHLYETD